MTNYFQYNNETSLKTVTKSGIDVIVYFDDKPQPSEIIFGEAEYICADDALNDVAALVSENGYSYTFISLAYLCHCAAMEWDDVQTEARQADAVEAEYESQQRNYAGMV